MAGDADGVPSALVDAGALRAEIGVGSGVEVGAVIGGDLDGLTTGGGLVKVQVPSRWPVAAFAGGSAGKTSFGVYQGQRHIRSTTGFVGVAVGAGGLAHPAGGYESLFPYASARLAWIDARETDDDTGTNRFRGISPGASVGVTLRETVGLSAEVGAQLWKGRAVPVLGLRLRI